MSISFNKSASFSQSTAYINQILNSNSLASNGNFTKQCESFLQNKFGYSAVLLTSSCTAALEICALIIKKYLPNKSEIIMPSYTFVSSANAFAKFGFKIKFVDVKEDMNMDEIAAIKAIDENSAAILAVNYGGSSPNLEMLSKKCKEKNIFFLEDNAQGIDAKYNQKYLGSFGDFSTFSFHETKNITSAGEGGAFICNNLKYLEDAKIIREKGTNREQFFRGMVDKYSWVDLGGHYLMNELGAAFLLGQLEHLDKITSRRKEIWNIYSQGLKILEEKSLIELQKKSAKNDTNGHLFYLKCRDLNERSTLIKHLKENNISAAFHYLPLHSSNAGVKYGEFFGSDIYSSKDSERLVRMPLFFDLGNSDVNRIIKVINIFYAN